MQFSARDVQTDCLSAALKGLTKTPWWGTVDDEIKAPCAVNSELTTDRCVGDQNVALHMLPGYEACICLCPWRVQAKDMRRRRGTAAVYDDELMLNVLRCQLTY